MSYKIIILGGYGLRNFGDDALMYVLHKKLSLYYDEIDIAYICTPDSYLKQIVNTSTVFDIRKNNSFDTEILLYGGGTQFYSFQPKKSFLYRLLQNLKHPFSLSKKIIKKINRRDNKKKNLVNKTAAIGIGVGPFLPNADHSVEMSTKNLFLDMDFIGVRDDYSFNKCKEWGIANVQQYSDLCYLMEHEFEFENRKISHGVKKVGIIVRDWNQTDEGAAYYTKITPLISRLSQLGYNANIIIFSQKRDSYWLKELKDNNVLIWNPDKNSIQEFITKLDEYDLFVTARYHGAVFSTLLGKPFVSISVEQKLDMVSDLYKNGSKKWLYPFDVDECVDYVKEIDENYNKFKKAVDKITLEQKKLAKNMLQDFLDYVNDNMRK